MPDFIVRFFIRFSLSDLFICTIFLFRFSVGFICLIFSPISCSIFLSDLFVSIYMSDSFILFLSDLFYPTCLCPIFCPIFFVRFLPDSMSRLFVRFFVPFFWPICCHIFCVISLQKRWNMSRHVMPPLSCTINVLVFLLL